VQESLTYPPENDNGKKDRGKSREKSTSFLEEESSWNPESLGVHSPLEGRNTWDDGISGSVTLHQVGGDLTPSTAQVVQESLTDSSEPEDRLGGLITTNNGEGCEKEKGEQDVLEQVKESPYSEVLAGNNSKVQELYTDQAGLGREREVELPQCKEGKDPSRKGIQLNRDGVEEALGSDSEEELEDEYGEDLHEMLGRALRGHSPLEITVPGVVVTGGEQENRINWLVDTLVAGGHSRVECNLPKSQTDIFPIFIEEDVTSPELQLLIDTRKEHMKGSNKEHASELPPPEPPPEMGLVEDPTTSSSNHSQW
jgi:hypothetical protein